MATKTAISFGLVHIPISLHTATTDSDVRFNQLHVKDNARIKYKKICSHCHEEVTANEIVKGYEYEKNQYVLVTEEDFENIKTQRDKIIHIIHFASLSEINPIYFQKPYYAIAEIGGEKAYELLRKALITENKVAVAKTVLGTKETLLALIPTPESILIQTMCFYDEIKEMPKKYIIPEVKIEELKMAKTLVNSLTKPFLGELYKDEYQEKLKELISDKVSGKETVVNNSIPQGSVIDLMEALKKSIRQVGAS